jgi:putative ABC transport system permease protein
VCLITFLSFLVAIAIFELTRPFFATIVGRNIDISLISNPSMIAYLLGAWLALTIVAGFYPTIVLTSFKPTQILKGNFRHSKYGGLVRKSLVVFQFVISSALIVGTLVVYNQINYMKNKKLGFAKNQILVLSMDKIPEDFNLDTFKKELIQHSNIQHVSSSNAYPGKTRNGMLINADGMDEDEQLLVWNWHVDQDYLNTMVLELIAGKDFTKRDQDLEDQEFIINETALLDIGWDLDNCVGREIKMGQWKGHCIGVIKDFNFSSLQQKVEPLLLDSRSNAYRKEIMVRFGEGDLLNTIDFIENKWQQLIPENIFSYKFLDESFDQLFDSEQRTAKAFNVFSSLSILIASLGLFGLSAYEVLSRTKEIGIRKSIGSSSLGIFQLLVKQFYKLALLAFIISAPIAYFIMNKWLQNFVYRISVTWLEFGFAVIITLLIVLLSIGYHTIRAALIKPVDSLRYE